MRVALRNVAMEFFPCLFIPGLIPAILHALSVSDKLVGYGSFTADK